MRFNFDIFPRESDKKTLIRFIMFARTQLIKQNVSLCFMSETYCILC